jgi:hypothetical protein
MKYFLSFTEKEGKPLKLDGTSKLPGMDEMEVILKPVKETFFPDEWDPVIKAYLAGNPTLTPGQIDSVFSIAYLPDAPPEVIATSAPSPVVPEPPPPPPPDPPVVKPPIKRDPPITEALNTRQKVVQATIPVKGDTIELRFYDNAEVDGDSISLFANGVLQFQHVFLREKPHIYILDLSKMAETVELAMVAENVGVLPPNTAFMVAFADGKRYTARIESNEKSSGVIKIVRVLSSD